MFFLTKVMKISHVKMYQNGIWSSIRPLQMFPPLYPDLVSDNIIQLLIPQIMNSIFILNTTKHLLCLSGSISHSTCVESCQSDWELVVLWFLVPNCSQLTSQEFDCVYEIISCQKHNFTMDVKTLIIQVKTTVELLTRSIIRSFKKRWPTFLQVRSKKKNTPGNTTQLAREEAN